MIYKKEDKKINKEDKKAQVISKCEDSEQKTTEELVAMAQAGDMAAEELLLRSFRKEIGRISKMYFIKGAELEDAMQEAMIGLFKAIHSYQTGSEASFKTYARVCMSRQLISAVKAANRKKHSPLNESISLERTVIFSDSDGDEVNLADVIEEKTEPDPYTIALLSDVFNYINKNESVFSELEKTVWNKFLLGSSYDEIATSLGKERKAIYNAMLRIKKKILKYLEV